MPCARQLTKRPVSTRLLMLVVAATAVVGGACRDRDQVPALETVNARDTLWYARARALDATADGKPDTLWLRAHGRRGDSLDIALTMVSAGREILREEWASDYMLVDPPFIRPAPQAVVDSFVRARLDSTLARVSLVPVARLDFRAEWPPVFADCTGDPRDCIAYALREERAAVDWTKLSQDSARAARLRIETDPFDTAAVLAIADDIRRNAGHYLSLSYGYETSLSYAWSPRAQRFYKVFECC